MSLPDGGNVAWPPAHCDPINKQIATWAAWYSGDADQLTAIYAGTTGQNAGKDFFASEAGGVKATARRAWDSVRRWFWGNRSSSGQPRNRVHVPLAGDIAAASADLLFSDPPRVTTDDKATQERLDELLDDGAQAVLLEAAEIAAALGGVYLRVCWDPEVRPDRPWIAAVQPDAAVPEFTFGKLTAVTFWRVIKRTKRTVVRHLERHENGLVLHAVYEGTDDELGQPVPFADYPETAWLNGNPDVVNGNEIHTGLDGLAAVYVPNMRPNRVWRNIPGAAALGRSDYAGVEAMMDGLDLTMSSWLRDVELGKARLIVPKEYLQTGGPGQGAGVDLDREVYEPVNAMSDDDGKPAIEQVQFDIRVDAHQRTVDAFKTTIVSTAGYAAATFGLDTEGSAQTATEVAAKHRRSLLLRGRKIRYFRPELVELLGALLGIDATIFHTRGVNAEADILVEWPDGVSEDPKDVAQILQLLEQAGAISTEEKVKMLHPDWEDDDVAEEVDRIHAEHGVSVENPDTFTGAPPADEQPPPPDGQEPPAEDVPADEQPAQA